MHTIPEVIYQCKEKTEVSMVKAMCVECECLVDHTQQAYPVVGGVVCLHCSPDRERYRREDLAEDSDYLDRFLEPMSDSERYPSHRYEDVI